MIANAYPAHTVSVLEEKIILKLNTRIILKIVTSDVIEKSETYPSLLTERDVMYALT